MDSEVVAVGGLLNGKAVDNSEKYLISSNKWSELPRLNSDRFCSGSVLLKSKRMFTFCGIKAYQDLNSIESLQPGIESEWKILPVNYGIAKVAQLAATSF